MKNFQTTLKHLRLQNPKYLIEYLNENRNAVVLAKEGLPIDFSKIPSETSFAYLVEAYGVAECNGQKAICKYQKVSDLYKDILNVFSEKESNNYRLQGKKESENVIVIYFSEGRNWLYYDGVCLRFKKSKRREKVFYLNLEELGTVWMNFTADGKYTMSDVHSLR